MKQAHLITVLGREIPVRSSASAEKVRAVEALVNSQIDRIRGGITSTDPQLLAILALLNLAELYLELQVRHESSASEARVAQLLDRLDKVLETPGLFRET